MLDKKFFFILLLLFAYNVQSQQMTVKEMRHRVTRLQQSIKEKERILLSSEKDIASKLKNLNLLTAQIRERKLLIDLLLKEVDVIDKSIDKLVADIKQDEARIAKSKEEYANALNRVRRYGTLQDKLLFIVSADDFNSMLHRYRYAREYMNAHRKLAEKLKADIAALALKRAEIEKKRADKIVSLEEQKREQQTLKSLEDKQRDIVSELNCENKKVKKELSRQRNELNNLNIAIDKEIEREIAARRKAEKLAVKRKKEVTQGKKIVTQKDKIVSTDKITRKEKAVVNPNSTGMKKLTGSFLQNKGQLPSPITGPYMLVGTFGPQRGVEGKGNVRIDYGGITLQGERGAKARAVFKGVVTSVVRAGDFAFVIVRHGKYLTVYCKLQNIRVSQGDEVELGDVLADVATDISGSTTLLFQIRNEKVKLNPRHWLDL